MAVKIGSARIDERGKTTGGKAGDQTGIEVSTQSWYKHSKGWRTFRARDARVADKIAEAMELACACKRIGYDQNQRNTLYNAIKDKGFDIRKLDVDVETDCSALVRVCLAYAGIMVSDFNTSSEAARLGACPDLVELTESKYNTKSDYLQRGDIQVTKTKGHTVVVLSSGPKAEGWGDMVPAYEHHLGERILKNGSEGSDVKELQTALVQLGYSCGSYGCDGEFGDATQQAVRRFQQDSGCDVDGEVGPETLAALEEALGGDAITGYHVNIMGGNCYVRSAPNTNATKMGVAREGDMYPFGGAVSPDGWLLIEYQGQNGWVSGKYGAVV